MHTYGFCIDFDIYLPKVQIICNFKFIQASLSHSQLEEIFEHSIKALQIPVQRPAPYLCPKAGRHSLRIQTGNAGERGNNDESDLREERGLLNLKITYTYSLLIHCLQIPRRNQTIQKRSFCI